MEAAYFTSQVVPRVFNSMQHLQVVSQPEVKVEVPSEIMAAKIKAS